MGFKVVPFLAYCVVRISSQKPQQHVLLMALRKETILLVNFAQGKHIRLCIGLRKHYRIHTFMIVRVCPLDLGGKVNHPVCHGLIFVGVVDLLLFFRFEPLLLKLFQKI